MQKGHSFQYEKIRVYKEEESIQQESSRVHMLIAKELVKTLRNICSEQTVTFRNDNIVKNGARKISSLAKKGKQET